MLDVCILFILTYRQRNFLSQQSIHKSFFNDFWNGAHHACYACSKDLQNGTLDGWLFANGGYKSERLLRQFECETTATTDCLVDIPAA